MCIQITTLNKSPLIHTFQFKFLPESFQNNSATSSKCLKKYFQGFVDVVMTLKCEITRKTGVECCGPKERILLGSNRDGNDRTGEMEYSVAIAIPCILALRTRFSTVQYCLVYSCGRSEMAFSTLQQITKIGSKYGFAFFQLLGFLRRIKISHIERERVNPTFDFGGDVVISPNSLNNFPVKYIYCDAEKQKEVDKRYVFRKRNMNFMIYIKSRDYRKDLHTFNFQYCDSLTPGIVNSAENVTASGRQKWLENKNDIFKGYVLEERNFNSSNNYEILTTPH
ncbi:hypothetical protein BDC45DRAFT_540472 [Circinella umbellata]|nr:hypothetical protein BDC45DRAFT_540472 [Circinella umbellata]